MTAASVLKVIARLALSALVAVGLVGPTAGCYSFQTTTAPLKVGETWRLEFPQGVLIPSLAHPQEKDTIVMRMVTAIEGTVVRSTADSLLLVVRRTFPTVPRAPEQIVAVPQSPTMRIQQRQPSASRTALLLLGIGAAVLGFFAWVAAEMEYGPASAPGSGF